MLIEKKAETETCLIVGLLIKQSSFYGNKMLLKVLKGVLFCTIFFMACKLKRDFGHYHFLGCVDKTDYFNKGKRPYWKEYP